ncbi:16S rRNA (guanine(966)-N(2))-methyltransferase RsmD [Sporosarcina sp. Te-1]|uniref:16S rRNA (guanine(966)-N(2))-methyltransferase RsmD n=1 Tax=Sporosarcina sp. Te-1 TaxID=2818390 RepID=UPI001A9CE546|nr:16S rRNA (guanine(966)-N(2))-methyltransferase RsmD [Sporosarcina sp. Te-1]QTD42421.1 16S rRNA (guanine(966)-N(2))-methyltransferase RsmD [Sporosarcina sp. Te-1]
MRIVSGSRRGIPLKALPGDTTRPTTDKVKESLFNMIGPYFDGGISVELFGGSGSLSLEALSRGADSAYVFERNARACAIIKENAEKCRFHDELVIFRSDARNAAKKLKSMDVLADYLFIDPPYAQTEFYGLINDFIELELLTSDAIIICEHDKKMDLPESYGDFSRAKHVIYGSSAISIYRK